MTHTDDITQYDNIFDAADWEYIWKVIRFPKWQFGHVSSNSADNIPFWVMDLKEDKFFAHNLFRKILDVLQQDLSLDKVYANGATYGQTGSRHTDSSEEGAKTFLIYANRTWEPQWGGRTVFLLNDGERLVFPKPGTAVCFPANIPHFAEDVSRKCLGLRVTVAYKLSMKR